MASNVQDSDVRRRTGDISPDEVQERRPRRWQRTATRAVAAFAVFVLAGNAIIFAAFLTARVAAPEPDLSLPGIEHLRAVDARLWRGDAPLEDGYEALATQGVTTIVNLRAEDDFAVDRARAAESGMEWVHIPIRDGQAPPPENVRRFLDVVEASPGRVYVHCGAGVGRTGTMAGAYLVREAGEDPLSAVRRNLAVGPPSLEQIVFVADLEPSGPIERPSAVVTGLSRLWDAPRRIYTSYLRH